MVCCKATMGNSHKNCRPQSSCRCTPIVGHNNYNHRVGKPMCPAGHSTSPTSRLAVASFRYGIIFLLHSRSGFSVVASFVFLVIKMQCQIIDNRAKRFYSPVATIAVLFCNGLCLCARYRNKPTHIIACAVTIIAIVVTAKINPIAHPNLWVWPVVFATLYFFHFATG